MTSTRKRILAALSMAVAMASSPMMTPEPASAAVTPTIQMATVTNSGQVLYKATTWGQWSQLAPAGYSKQVTLSPNGEYLASVTTLNALYIRDNKSGVWDKHTGDKEVKSVAISSNWAVAIVSPCGAVGMKTSQWGQWTELAPCGYSSQVSLSPNGRYLASVTPLKGLYIRDNQTGQWAQHIGDGSVVQASIGANGSVATVGVCGSVGVKSSLSGPWTELAPCGYSRQVTLAADGTLSSVTPLKAVYVRAIDGTWEQHTGDNQVVHASISSPMTPSVRTRIVDIARSELAKDPAENNGDNVVRYNGGTGALAPYSISAVKLKDRSWCASFASWVWQQAGVGNPKMTHCGNGSPGSIQGWAESNTELRPLPAGPRVGDLILFGRSGACDHVAVVVGVRSDGAIQTIGGNEGHRVRFTDWTMPTSLQGGTAYAYASPVRGA